MVHRAYEQYVWTGDRRWIEDPVLLDYYEFVMTDFVDVHYKEDDDGIADVPAEKGIHVSYYEFEREKLRSAADAFGSQYRATVAYSRILAARGENEGAKKYEERAANLLRTLNDQWFCPVQQRFVRGITRSRWQHTPQGAKLLQEESRPANFGRENSFFIPLKFTGVDLGERMDDYIDFVHHRTYVDDINIEARTYYPELMYAHGRAAYGWHWLVQSLGTKDRYPEVAFTGVNNVLTGLMGIRGDAVKGQVSTVPRLIGEVPWVAVDHLPVGSDESDRGKNNLFIRHDGNTKTTLKNNAGPNITWQAVFYGEHATLLVDGAETKAKRARYNGQMVSYVSIDVAADSQHVVEVADRTNHVFLSDLDWSEADHPDKTGRDVNTKGTILAANGRYFEKGIGMPGESSVEYALDGKYQQFVAEIAVEEPGRQNSWSGGIVFRVLTDVPDRDNELVDAFMSDELLGETKQVVVDVRGCNRLKLDSWRSHLGPGTQGRQLIKRLIVRHLANQALRCGEKRIAMKGRVEPDRIRGDRRVKIGEGKMQIAFVLVPHGIRQLVLMKVDDFRQPCSGGTKPQELGQIEHVGRHEAVERFAFEQFVRLSRQR